LPKPQEDVLVVAISPFYYLDESGKSGSDINTRDDLAEKLLAEKNLGIKVIKLDSPIYDADGAKSQGKKVGSHLVIYGETKSKIGKRGEVEYHILPLSILETIMIMPYLDVENEEKNLLLSQGASFSMVTETQLLLTP